MAQGHVKPHYGNAVSIFWTVEGNSTKEMIPLTSNRIKKNKETSETY